MSRPRTKRGGGPSIEDEIPLWEFIYQNVVVNEIYKEVAEPLFEAYAKSTERKFTVEQWSAFYTSVMKPGLYKTNLENEKILELYMALEIEISPHAEHMLEMRCGAGLRIDEDRFLIHYMFLTEPKAKKMRPGVEVEEKKQDATPILQKAPVQSSEVPEGRDEQSSSERPALPAQKKKPDMPNLLLSDVTVDKELEKHMWMHISNNIQTLTAKMLCSVEFWQALLDSLRMPIKSSIIVARYFQSNLLNDMWRLPKTIDVNVKMRLLKDLLVPITPHQKNWLLSRQNVRVTLTDDGYVSSWKCEEPDPPFPRTKISTWTPRFDPPRPQTGPAMCDETASREARGYSRGGSVNNRDQSSSSTRYSQQRVPKIEEDDDMTASSAFKRTGRIPFTQEDDLQAWKFILKKMYDPTTKKLVIEGVQPKGNRFWEEFIRVTNSPKTSTNWSSHFRKKMCPTLHEIKLARDTKLMLYTHLNIPISNEVHRHLERECNAKIRLSSERHLLSWRFRSDDARERTIDTEPLVNDDEETDGESVTAAAPIMNDIEGSAQNGAVDGTRNIPSTSSGEGTRKKRRKSGEEDQVIEQPKEKEKRQEVQRTPMKKSADVSMTPAQPPSVPQPRVIPDEIEENVEQVIEECAMEPAQAEQEKEDVIIEDDDDELEEQEKDEEPFDLDRIAGGFMSKPDLLMAVYKAMETEGEEAHEVLNDAVDLAFHRTENQDKNSNEQVARLQITDAIASHGHPLHQEMLSVYQLELIDKTTECCENADVFRERLSQVSTNLGGRLQKMNLKATPPHKE